MDDNEWTNVQRKTQNKFGKKKNFDNKTKIVTPESSKHNRNRHEFSSDSVDVSTYVNNSHTFSRVERGLDKYFIGPWKVYMSLTESSDWTLNNYDTDFFVIDSIGKFHVFFNNFPRINTNMYTIHMMKSYEENNETKFVTPLWEDKYNANGGTYSMRMEITTGITLFQELCLLLLNNSFGKNTKIVNGISYYTKRNWAVIKLLTSEMTDSDTLFPDCIMGSNTNITPKYTKNAV